MTSGVSYDRVRDAGPSWRAGHPARASRHGAQCPGCVIVQQCVKCPDKRWQPAGRPAPSTSCNLWYPITRFNDTKRHCPRLNCNKDWGKGDIYENYLIIPVNKYLEFFCKSGNRFTSWTPVKSTWNVRRVEESPSGRVVLCWTAGSGAECAQLRVNRQSSRCQPSGYPTRTVQIFAGVS